MIYLTKDRELDSNMFQSKWKMKTHGIRSRVKDGDVLVKDMIEDETSKTLELFFLPKLYELNVRQPESDVRIR